MASPTIENEQTNPNRSTTQTLTNDPNNAPEDSQLGRKVTNAGTIKSNFFNILQTHLTDVLKHNRHKAAYSSSSSSSSPADYAPELSILKRHYNPIIWGYGSALIIFASFRLRSYAGRLIRVRPGTSGSLGGYKFENWPRSPSSSSPSSKKENARQELQNALSIPIDLILSFFLGSNIFLFLTDVPLFTRDASRLPLVHGRSFISEELCGDFVSEFRTIPLEFWKDQDVEKGGNDASLLALREFVLNCQKRRVAEKKVLRNLKDEGLSGILKDENESGRGDVDFLKGSEEKGGLDNRISFLQGVYIPYPGVSKLTPIEDEVQEKDL